MENETLKIPNHLAIIVDGNGRWATQRNLSRSAGHKAGADNIIKLSKYIYSKGVKVLSLFVFSTENFKRNKEEVDYIMNLAVTQLKNYCKEFMKENIKVVFSGRQENLNDKVIKTIEAVSEKTKNNTNGIVNFCFNYGGHTEIIDATKKIHNDINNNKLNINELTEETFSQYLYHQLPPIDLVIRTSGEMRISNFMIWQLSYAELYFANNYFPDFKEKDFDEALLNYTKRDRRFGGNNNEDKTH